ncbi:hypothetical protein SAMN05660860_03437 [Geoalkalibacter ferrihydriticus]|uniref:Uncharacterized protein n=2 Tax=Geoalkalibacter ferrihydriticus TaxID=392333 RepID=A0A0C2HES1_9BACT|nr:hypothetical protein [Geoalkalibacter ferrihydriticus]KIH75451.1 hypothetical protein GFER_16880 [Geoalkalibacter ferrihydriticus DSM 17813]SDM93986.1 hypothetical protein SAMN05660860_03437 [Geoalkalibacter ferrihydriticus]
MKVKSLLGALIVVLAGAGPALAAAGARQDNSGLVVWVFLGFCALIVVAQLLPALLMMLGVVKAVARDKEFTPQKVQNK